VIIKTWVVLEDIEKEVDEFSKHPFSISSLYQRSLVPESRQYIISINEVRQEFKFLLILHSYSSYLPRP